MAKENFSLSDVARAMMTTKQRVKNWVVGPMSDEVDRNGGRFTVDHVGRLAVMAELIGWGIKVSDAAEMADQLYVKHLDGTTEATIFSENGRDKSNLSVKLPGNIDPIVEKLEAEPEVNETPRLVIE